MNLGGKKSGKSGDETNLHEEFSPEDSETESLPEEGDHSHDEPPASPAIPMVSRIMQFLFFTFLIISILAFGVFAGPAIKDVLGGMFMEPTEEMTEASETETNEESTTWYIDTMHPWIIQPEPGLCPICAMELVPVDPDRFTGEIAIDPVVLQNIGVRVKQVTAGPAEMEIRTVGNVTYDETRVRDVNLKISGWVEKVHIDFEGSYVRKGQPLLEIYAPELYSTQEEYLLLYKRKDVPGNLNLLEAVKTRLALWDIKDEQVETLERDGKPSRTMTITAPFDGYVIKKHVNEGMRITPGMTVYRVADLRSIWVQVALYEYQLPYISVGQPARMSLSYLPNKQFEGRVSYVYPYLDEKTREVQVRLEFRNANVQLKPGMFADIYIGSSSTEGNESILAPSEALIRTGERNVAFVSLGDGKFEPRTVTIGKESRDGMVEVIDGLIPGDQVVVSGQFLLDSESRVRESLAKMIKGDLASEQLPEVEFPSAKDIVALPPAAQNHLKMAVESYIEIQGALYEDTLDGVDGHTRKLIDHLEQVGQQEIQANPHFWHEHNELGTIQKHAALLASATDLQRARIEFGNVGYALNTLLRFTGLPEGLEQEVMGVKCGMFTDAPDGGIWLQVAGKTRNPFYGATSAMNTCSSEKWAFATSGDSVGAAEQNAGPDTAHTGHEDTAAQASATAMPARPDNHGDHQETTLPAAADRALKNMMESYLALQESLFENSHPEAKKIAEHFSAALGALTAIEIPGDQHYWHKMAAPGEIREGISAIESSDDIESARVAFGQLSVALNSMLETTGIPSAMRGSLVGKRCGMYSDAPLGGVWFQRKGDVLNPFFGKDSPMAACATASWEKPSDIPSDK